MSDPQTADQPAPRVALLAADGVDVGRATALITWLAERGVECEVVAPHEGELQDRTNIGATLTVEQDFTISPTEYDAVLIPGGPDSIGELADTADARRFVEEAYRRGKPIGALDEGSGLLAQPPAAPGLRADVESRHGVVIGWSDRSGLRAIQDRVSGPGHEHEADIVDFAEVFLGAVTARDFPERPPLAEHGR